MHRDTNAALNIAAITTVMINLFNLTRHSSPALTSSLFVLQDLIRGQARQDIYLFDEQKSIRNAYNAELEKTESRDMAFDAALACAWHLPYRPSALRVAEALHNV
jgi:hypothetical protein